VTIVAADSAVAALPADVVEVRAAVAIPADVVLALHASAPSSSRQLLRSAVSPVLWPEDAASLSP